VHSILLYYFCTIAGGNASKDNLDDIEKTYIDMPEWIDIDKARSVKFYNTVGGI